jgi:hypothetical protein
MFLPLWVLITTGILLLLLAAGVVYASYLAYRHSQYSKKMFVRSLELIDQREKLAKLLVQHQRKAAR